MGLHGLWQGCLYFFTLLFWVYRQCAVVVKSKSNLTVGSIFGHNSKKVKTNMGGWILLASSILEHVQAEGMKKWPVGFIFLPERNQRWRNCHRHKDEGNSHPGGRNHETNSFWWVEVTTPLVIEGGLVYWLVDTATVTDTNMASPWRQSSGLCQQHIGHHHHHHHLSGFLLRQKWRVVNEREKRALCIPVAPSLALVLSHEIDVKVL
jgi:hypothetical protein